MLQIPAGTLAGFERIPVGTSDAFGSVAVPAALRHPKASHDGSPSRDPAQANGYPPPGLPPHVQRLYRVDLRHPQRISHRRTDLLPKACPAWLTSSQVAGFEVPLTGWS